MRKFKNAKKASVLNALPQSDIETSDIATRCKFNFSYFDANQEAGQDFCDWDNPSGLNSLVTLLNKLKDYTKEPLSYWENQKILVNYINFPENSDFTHPAHVPHDVSWARFRLGSKVRLAGFMIPEKIATEINRTVVKDFLYDSNTFYVVFLDREHLFYKTEKK